MKILIVSKVASHPVRMGNQRLIVDQVNLLKKLGHEVHYLFVYEKAMSQKKGFDNSVFASMNVFWKDKLHICKIPFMVKLYSNFLSLFRLYFCNGYCNCDDFYHFQIHRDINRLDKKYSFDSIIVNYYYLSKSLTKVSIPLKILLTHDSFIYRDMKVGEKVNGTLSPNEEAKALQRAPYILSVQEDESILFHFLSPLSKIYTIYTCFEYVSHRITANRNILFLAGNGKFNLNGLFWFIDNVFPSIIDRFSDAKLLVGGGICQCLKNYENNKHIHLLGTIEDTNVFYSMGDVFINPTYQGTGIKIKTFEAIANDMVTMAHPHSAEGIFMQKSAPLFYSDNVEEWCTFLERIWSDANEIKKIKVKNQKYIYEMNELVIEQYNSLFEQ